MNDMHEYEADDCNPSHLSFRLGLVATVKVCCHYHVYRMRQSRILMCTCLQLQNTLWQALPNFCKLHPWDFAYLAIFSGVELRFIFLDILHFFRCFWVVEPYGVLITTHADRVSVNARLIFVSELINSFVDLPMACSLSTSVGLKNTI